MKILLRTGCGESLPVALRLQDEGHYVKFAMADEAEDYQELGEGLIEKAKYDAKTVAWANMIVFDSNIFDLPKEAEFARKGGKLVVGSSLLSGQLENDRALAVQTAKSAGLSVPEYKEFSGDGAWAKAETFLSTLDKSAKMVWKPNGEAPASTFVSESLDEIIQMLPYWEKLFADHGQKPSFILTDKTEGEEISTEGWFNGKEFYLPNHTLERTRFFDGDHGEKTGCAGNVVWQGRTPLFDELFKNLVKVFGGKYAGPVDVNVIIEKKSNKPTFLEFTPRFGYDALFGLMELLQSDLGELFYNCASGKEWKGAVGNDFSGAVRVHVPPYPEPTAEDDYNRPVGLPMFGFPLNDKVRNFYPVEVMRKEGSLFTSGPDGYIAVVAARGATPEQAMEGAYKLVDKIRIPTMRYRMDLGSKLQEVFDTIKATGWIGKVAKPTNLPTVGNQRVSKPLLFRSA